MRISSLVTAVAVVLALSSEASATPRRGLGATCPDGTTAPPPTTTTPPPTTTAPPPTTTAPPPTTTAPPPTTTAPPPTTTAPPPTTTRPPPTTTAPPPTTTRPPPTTTAPPPTTTAPPSCTVEYGKDYYGMDLGPAIRVPQAEDCCDVCRKYPGCRAFSYTLDANGRYCYLKSGKSNDVRTNSNVASGVISGGTFAPRVRAV